jgi:hypothetical protein
MTIGGLRVPIVGVNSGVPPCCFHTVNVPWPYYTMPALYAGGIKAVQ